MTPFERLLPESQDIVDNLLYGVLLQCGQQGIHDEMRSPQSQQLRNDIATFLESNRNAKITS